MTNQSVDLNDRWLFEKHAIALIDDFMCNGVKIGRKGSNVYKHIKLSEDGFYSVDGLIAVIENLLVSF